MSSYYYSPNSSSKATGLDRRIIFLVLAGLFAVLLGSVLLFIGGQDGSKDTLQRIGARQEVLISLTTNAQKNITDPSLSKTNSDAALFFSSDNTILSHALSTKGIKGADKAAIARETDPDTAKRLEQALISGTFNSVYSTILIQQIETQQNLIRELSRKSPDASLQTITKQLYNSNESLLQQLKK